MCWIKFSNIRKRTEKKKFTERQGKGKDRCTFSPSLIFAVTNALYNVKLNE